MNPPTETSKIQQDINSTLNDIETKASSTRDSYDAKIRQSPEKAVLIAAAAGYCLNVLPTGKLIGVPIKLALLLAKPALLALGAVKVCEIAQSRARK